MKWKQILKIAAGVAFFLAIAFAEELIRSTQRESMHVNGLPLPNVQITAMWQPDFLWAGKAWWIDIETNVPLVIQLDTWRGEVPSGKHKVFGNHDYTNTGDYGKTQFWGKPKEVKVSMAPLE